MKSGEEWSSHLWTQFMQLRKRSPKKIHDFNGIYTRDVAIPVRRSNQQTRGGGGGELLPYLGYIGMSRLWRVWFSSSLL